MKLNSQFEAKRMIVYYKGSNHSHYFEKHEIVDGIPQEGHPLAEKDIIEISKEVSYKKKQKPISITYQWSYKLQFFAIIANSISQIWIRHSGKASLKFTKDTTIPSGDYELPQLVFMFKRNSLYVFAYKEYKGNGTKLFHLPIFNVSSNGLVCLGTVNTQKFNSVNQIMEHWESYFFNSEFTNTIHNPEAFQINAFDLWKQVYKTKKFPEELLVSADLTFQDLIDQLNEA